MSATKIPWTDAAWNPVTGCTRTSPGCANCYARRMAKRLKAMGRPEYQHDGDGPGFGVTLHPEKLDQPLHWRKPRRIFVCSMADLFHEDVPDKFIFDVFLTMAKAPQHTFQVLTKRPERARDWFASFREIKPFDDPWEQDATWLRLTGTPVAGWPLPNVWLGVTIENAHYTYRADILREIPAAVRFISAEPLLGSLFDWKRDVRPQTCEITGGYGPLDLTGIDWVIAGAESGPKRRPMELDWVRELRDACLAKCPECVEWGDPGIQGFGNCHDRPAFFLKQSYEDGRKIECPELDGRQWMEFPATPSSREKEA